MRYPAITTILMVGLLLGGCGRSDTGTGSLPADISDRTVLNREGTASAVTQPSPTIDEKVIPTYAPVTLEPNTVIPTIGTVEEPAVFDPRVERRAAGAGTIVEGTIIPLLKVYKISNYWYAETPTELIAAYVGAEYHNPQQGMILVTHRNPNVMEPLQKSEYVTTPVKVGALRILDANGMILHLKAEDGSDWFFDVSTSKFVK